MFWFESVHPDTGEALEVEAVYFQPRRGERDGLGVPLEPDEEEAVVVLEVYDRGGGFVAFEPFRAALEREGLEFAQRKT